MSYPSHSASAEQTAKSITDKVVDGAASIADAAADRIDQAKHVATDLAAGATRTGREAARNVDAVASNMKGAIEKSIKDQPMTTLAVAALTGLVIGAIWKS